MSHHTFLSVKYLRRLSTFSPAQSSFGLSLGNAGSDAGRSGLFSATFLYQVSSVTEVFYVVVTMYNTYPFPLLITCQILGSNSIIECKSEKNQYCRPSPHPPSTSFGRPSLWHWVCVHLLLSYFFFFFVRFLSNFHSSFYTHTASFYVQKKKKIENQRI